MNKTIADALYEGKFFYEILDTEKPMERLLIGPLDNILYVLKPNSGENTVIDDKVEYEFIQVVGGIPRVAFTKDQILVTDRKL